MRGVYLTDPNIVDHRYDGVKPLYIEEDPDKAWWMGSSSREFSVKIAWDTVRARCDKKEEEKLLWVKGLPFKINFFFWKAW